jgi:hypothetical protein
MTGEQHNDLDEAADFCHWRIPAASNKEFVVHSNRMSFREAARQFQGLWQALSDWSQVGARNGQGGKVPPRQWNVKWRRKKMEK